MATFQELEQQVNNLQNNVSNFNSLSISDKDGFYVTVSIPGTNAATATNYGPFFTARHPMEVLWVSEVHAVAGSDGSAVTLDIEKLTGTTAPGSGTSVLASTYDLKGTANTVVIKEGVDLSLTGNNRQLNEQDRLALVDTGTLTAVASVQVTLYCKYLGRGTYR